MEIEQSVVLITEQFKALKKIKRKLDQIEEKLAVQKKEYDEMLAQHKQEILDLREEIIKFKASPVSNTLIWLQTSGANSK